MNDTKTALLVEDSIAVAIATKHILKTAGYEATHVISGDEAIALAETTAFTLILMDIGLGEGNMDGVETTVQIRAIETQLGRNHCPIFAVTSHVQEKDKEFYESKGMNGTVEKPLNPEKLESLLASLDRP